jgi:putative ABC transport system permease protein
LRIHDLKVTLTPGTFASPDDLAALVDTIPSSSSVTASAPRLVVPSQIDVPGSETPSGEGVLVRSVIVGADPGGPDALWMTGGRDPVAGAQRPEVVLEQKFASYYGLGSEGGATLAGGSDVDWVGTGVGPEYLYITVGGEVAPFGEANYAVVFTSLTDAQRITGLSGQANEVVLTLDPGVDPDVVRNELIAAVEAQQGLSATVSTRAEEPAYRLLYDDLEGDQTVWTAITLLVLAAASLAAFNLVGRVGDAQRREIGIQMAFGVPPHRIALRPVVMAAQVALLGALVGVGVGLWAGAALKGVFESFLPLPQWVTPFQFGAYARAAALGFVVPFAASILPVRRVVRMEPVAAIGSTSMHQPRRSRRATVRHGGRPSRRTSVSRLPVRNTVRNLRRTVLTALGVGVAVATLVAVLGMLDSFVGTVNRSEDEILRTDPTRISVQLEGFVPSDGAVVGELAGLDGVAAVEPQLVLPGVLDPGPEEIDLAVTVLNLDDGLSEAGTPRWTPTLVEVADPGDRPGIVLAAKALEDLSLEVGDEVVTRVPTRSTSGFVLTDVTFRVSGVHADPIRTLAYVDVDDAGALGLGGVTNSVVVTPASGTSTDALRRAAFDLPGIATIQPVADLTGLLADALDQFSSALAIAGLAVLVLAGLVAFNSSAISVDERQREHATLFAFGLPVGRVVRLLVVEGLVVGIAATMVGLAGGYVLVRWIVGSVISETVPDIGLVVEVSGGTVVAAVVTGVVAVACTPLLLTRRLMRMSIPDALRVME